MQTNHTLYSYQYLHKISNTSNSFIHKMITLFLNSLKEYLDDFDDLLRTHNLADTKKVVHKLKPSVLNLEVQGAKALITSLEQAENWGPDVEKEIAALKDLFKKIIPYMEDDLRELEKEL